VKEEQVNCKKNLLIGLSVLNGTQYLENGGYEEGADTVGYGSWDPSYASEEESRNAV